MLALSGILSFCVQKEDIVESTGPRAVVGESENQGYEVFLRHAGYPVVERAPLAKQGMASSFHEVWESYICFPVHRPISCRLIQHAAYPRRKAA